MKTLKTVLLLLVLVISGCGGGSKVTRGAKEKLGPGSWTVDGVRPAS